MPSVDVVVPAYNPGRFLAPALVSVIAQTHLEWQAVVVDDGSAEDLSWVEKLDPRIRLVRQANTGVSGARNRAINIGVAPLVAFLDADDIWLPRKLELQIAAIKPAVSLCSTAFEIIDEHGERTGDGFSGYATSRRELLQGNGICLSTALVHRDHLAMVGGFATKLRIVQDWDLWIRLSAVGEIIKLPDVLAHYRIHGDNATADYLRFFRESQRLLRDYASGPDAEWARIGQRELHALAGTQAFDAFRASRRPVHLARAFRWNAPYTVGALVSKVRARSG